MNIDFRKFECFTFFYLQDENIYEYYILTRSDSDLLLYNGLMMQKLKKIPHKMLGLISAQHLQMASLLSREVTIVTMSNHLKYMYLNIQGTVKATKRVNYITFKAEN